MKSKRKFFDRPIMLATVILMVLLALYFIKLRGPQLAEANTATIIVSFSDQDKKVFQGPVVEDMTILEALFASTQDESSTLNVVYHVDPRGDVNIAEINNRINLNGRQWWFYVNGEAINTGDINKIKIHTGDTIELKYEASTIQ